MGEALITRRGGGGGVSKYQRKSVGSSFNLSTSGYDTTLPVKDGVFLWMSSSSSSYTVWKLCIIKNGVVENVFTPTSTTSVSVDVSGDTIKLVGSGGWSASWFYIFY